MTEWKASAISGIAAAASGSPGAPPLLAGTGKDQVHLLLVCTGERGLCGAFNSAIVRLAREHAQALVNQGKEVKFFCVGRKGFEQLRRTFEKQIVETVELRSVRQLAFVNADDIARGLSRFNPEGAAIAAGRLMIEAQCDGRATCHDVHRVGVGRPGRAPAPGRTAGNGRDTTAKRQRLVASPMSRRARS